MCNENNKKSIVKAHINSNKEISTNIYEMIFVQEDISKNAKPGQFVNIYCKSEAMILPRPISICEVNTDEKTVKIVYAVVGKGTKEMSKLKKGDTIEVLGPLGNGFTIDEDSTLNIVVGGGVGTPPMLELVKRLPGKTTAFLGFRSEPYLVEEISKYATVHVATDDGKYGQKGSVIDLMNMNDAKGQIIYSCGPKPMLKALKEWANDKNILAQISLEERMGCGVGSCVGCVVKIKEDNEQGWIYKKACKDGPVFLSKEVMFDE